MMLLETLSQGVDVVVTSPVDDAWIVSQVRLLCGAQGGAVGTGPVVLLGGNLPRLRRLESQLRAGLTRVAAVRTGAGPLEAICEPPSDTDVVVVEQRWLPLLALHPARAWLVLDDVWLAGESPQVEALGDARHFSPTVCLCTPEHALAAAQVLRLYRPAFISALPVEVASEPSMPESSEQAILFESLRNWRAKVARNEGVPAYRVFSNRQLQALIASKPRTKEEFLSVPGIGDKTWEQYGPDFLQHLSAVS